MIKSSWIPEVQSYLTPGVKNMTQQTPFQTSWFLQTFADNFIQKDYPIDMSFPFEKVGATLIFLGMRKVMGKEEVTDYGDADIDPALLLQKTKEMGCLEIVLDYVREDSHLYHYFNTQKNGTIHLQEVSPFIQLPQTWNTYLETLDRVERKELKRKLKRLETIPYSFEVFSSNNEEAFSELIKLHKLSNTHKDTFMSPEMENFFYDLGQVPKVDWQMAIATLKIKNKYVAAILFFENNTTAMLYNSGYDPAYKYYSNGLMLHALLIKRNMEKGLKVHDFLRGKERYKYDLGGKDLNLYKISITL